MKNPPPRLRQLHPLLQRISDFTRNMSTVAAFGIFCYNKNRSSLYVIFRVFWHTPCAKRGRIKLCACLSGMKCNVGCCSDGGALGGCRPLRTLRLDQCVCCPFHHHRRHHHYYHKGKLFFCNNPTVVSLIIVA